MQDQGSSGALLFILVTIAFVIVALFRSSRSQQKPVGRTPGIERKDSFQEAKVHRVIDGDTVIVSMPRRKIKIRLDSIDCPEQGQHWGDTAKYGLIKLIGGRKIFLEDHGQDCYGRTLATIYVEQGGEFKLMNVNARMVTLGHAWVMHRFYGHLPEERQDELNRLERWARSKKVGLWKKDNPVSPWTWRRSDG